MSDVRYTVKSVVGTYVEMTCFPLY